MHKSIFAVVASLLCCSSVSAFWQEAADASLEVGVGYRVDSIEWKRDYNRNCSGSSSEYEKYKTKWKDIDIWMIEARGDYVTCDNIYLRGSIDYGWINSGKINRSIDINNNRNYSSCSFKTKDHDLTGNVWDGKLALGYQFRWCDSALTLTPVIGYSWQGSELRDDKNHYSSRTHSKRASLTPASDAAVAKDAAENQPPATADAKAADNKKGDSSSSSSSSENKNKMSQRWIGPFVGLDAEYQFCCDWTLHGTYEFHWSEYHASEKNLFNDYIAPFGSYTVNSKCQGRNNIHGNHAYGNLLNLGLKWNVCDCWTVGVRGEFKWWYVDDARESRKIKTDCCGDTEIKTYFSSKVKEINWCSASVIVDASLSF